MVGTVGGFTGRFGVAEEVKGSQGLNPWLREKLSIGADGMILCKARKSLQFGVFSVAGIASSAGPGWNHTTML